MMALDAIVLVNGAGINVVDKPTGGCEITVEAIGVALAISLDAGQAIALGLRLLDGGLPPDSTDPVGPATGPATDVPDNIRAAVGRDRHGAGSGHTTGSATKSNPLISSGSPRSQET